MLIANLLRFDSYGVLFAVAVVTTWLLLRARWKMRPKSTASARPTSRETSVQSRQGTEQWQVALQEFTREAEARLATRAAMLQQLLAAADERIARLEAQLAERPQRPTQAEAKESKKPPLDGPHFASSQKITASHTARSAAVFAMADAGNTAAAIARELGTSIGEIELILSLRATKR